VSNGQRRIATPSLPTRRDNGDIDQGPAHSKISEYFGGELEVVANFQVRVVQSVLRFTPMFCWPRMQHSLFQLFN
jgi:hypothetical protein